MKSAVSFKEKALWEIWKDGALKNRTLKSNNTTIEILSPGQQNPEDGPDFKEARIRINGLIYVGDIEIDVEYSGWNSHKHNKNPKYNKTILHVVFDGENKNDFVLTESGRKVSSVAIKNVISENAAKKIDLSKNIIESKSSLKCLNVNDKISIDYKLIFIRELGEARFKSKIEKMYKRLKELIYIRSLDIKEPIVAYDIAQELNNKKYTPESFIERANWEQLFYEYLFEALGYTKNKEPMSTLAKNININIIKKALDIRNETETIESLLFKISGLMPEVEKRKELLSDPYIGKLYSIWKTVSNIYDGSFQSEVDWQFYKLRPGNFPTLRIAAGSRYLMKIIKNNLVGRALQTLKSCGTSDSFLEDVINLFIISADGYWKNHFIFEKDSFSESKYFVGCSRAGEIVVNAVLPFAALYGNIFNEKELIKNSMELYLNSRAIEKNSVISKIQKSLGVPEESLSIAESQGMIELYKKYCSRGKCKKCKIGEKLFN